MVSNLNSTSWPPVSIAHIRFTIKVATEEVISPPPCQDSPHQEENGVGGNRSIFLEFLAIFLKARRDFPHPMFKTVHLQFTMHAVWLTKHVNKIQIQSSFHTSYLSFHLHRHSVRLEYFTPKRRYL